MIRLSILDQSVTAENQTAEEALRQTVKLAQEAEQYGYDRDCNAAASPRRMRDGFFSCLRQDTPEQFPELIPLRQSARRISAVNRCAAAGAYSARPFI
jgi:hypothetical protein